ncbi:SRPBCC family protein [Phytohabitans sp. ZYX-F-186]|uniref:SRPBCC family protein n=1 Tax=Phytohabitans maris TaxID=3071409 RepID=A0ABU0ZRC4_9ACTN|nr:SRPBCC family protein [Phytohabitans sp. ZYX-F-186]MDQ7908780.1 SRPBCC family protein [Phytohabitans sp. ZYX-F-186]
MRLDNEFVVPRPVDEAWAVLTDIERIAPCMPGAKLTEVDGDDYHGTVKVKVGPVVAQYAGVARFRERDAGRHHAVIEANGKQSGGTGRASAVVTADLAGEGDSTRVTVVTDLTVAGPLAQFGRGAIAQVSGKLLDQFVAQLRETVLADASSTAAPSTAAGGPTAAAANGAGPGPSGAGPAGAGAGAGSSGGGPSAAGPAGAGGPAPGHEAGADDVPAAGEPAPVDLLRAAAAPVLIRLIPVLVAIAVVIVLIVWLT